MRALQVTERSKLEFVDAEMPAMQPGHVLVKPRTLSLCGSDIWLLDHAPEGRYPCPPGTTGHEVIAEVVDAGTCSDRFRVGELTLTLAPDHCGMSEFYLAPVENVLPLPTRKSPEEYLMAQQLGTVIYSCRYMPSVIGKTVAVVGQGSAGLWFNVMMKRFGARRVIAFDSHEHRRDVGLRMGADVVLDGKSDAAEEQMLANNAGQHADIVVEAAGRESSINLAFRLAKDYEGFLMQFGLPRDPLRVDYSTMFWRRITVKSMVHAAREPSHSSTKRALELIDEDLDVKPLLTHRFSFDDVHSAFEVQRRATDGAVKTLVEMP
ncbi:MAG: zinc-binding dehydrogenase [Planctomycetota bacterium]